MKFSLNPARWFEKSSSADALERILVSTFGRPTKSGVTVTDMAAMQSAAVWACVRLLAEDVAKLPLILYKRTKNGGKERATDHRLYKILHRRPNEWQTSMGFREVMQMNFGLRGNAYAFINRVGGEVRELLPIAADRVTVKQNDDYSLRYDVSRREGPPQPFDRTQILHIRGPSLDGITGLNPIALHRETIGTTLAAEGHAARLFANGAQMAGILELPGKLDAEAAKRFKDSWQVATTGENAFKIALLEGGAKWIPTGINNKDAQFLEARQFGWTQIASLYRVPPHKIQDLSRSTNNNIEQQALEYVIDCLMPHLTRWEQQISEDLLSEEERDVYFAEFLVDALLRGDMASRYTSYNVAIMSGFMSRNEVRTRENLNPEPGLDQFLEPLNMVEPGARPNATPPAAGKKDDPTVKLVV